MSGKASGMLMFARVFFLSVVLLLEALAVLLLSGATQDRSQEQWADGVCSTIERGMDGLGWFSVRTICSIDESQGSGSGSAYGCMRNDVLVSG